MNSAIDGKNDPPSSQSVEQEFNDFVYIVSHDLNAPLRHIQQATAMQSLLMFLVACKRSFRKGKQWSRWSL